MNEKFMYGTCDYSTMLALQESICLGLEIDMELAQSMIECMCSKMNIEYHQNKTISREEFKNLVKILTKENA